MKTKITLLIGICLSAMVVALEDPNFPTSATTGKNIRATHPSTHVDKDFIGNFYYSIPSGAKFTNFVLLNPSEACAEDSGSYFKYSVTCDNCTPTTQYLLVDAIGGQPPLGAAVNPGFNAISVGKPAPQNAIAWRAGNSATDCHTTGGCGVPPDDTLFRSRCQSCLTDYLGGLFGGTSSEQQTALTQCYFDAESLTKECDPVNDSLDCESTNNSTYTWACGCGTSTCRADCTP